MSSENAIRATEWKTIVFRVHNFESLKAGTYGAGQYETHAIQCHGHQWRVLCFPPNVSKTYIFFGNGWSETGGKVDKPPKCEYTITVGKFTLQGSEYPRGEPWGNAHYMERSDALQSLDEQGTLNVIIKIRCWLLEKEPLWRPSKGLQQKVNELFKEKNGADCNGQRQISGSPVVKFVLDGGKFAHEVHKLVLTVQCPSLDKMVSGSIDPTNVPLDGVKPDLFRVLIYFMCYGTLPDNFDVKMSGIDLLKLSDQFQYVDLKMHLEADLVEAGMITFQNAAECLLWADAHSCALLKEHATDTVVAYPAEVMKTTGWKSLKESRRLLTEVYSAYAKANEGDNDQNERVISLRKKLSSHGMDVNGTKEMLLERLKALP